MLLLTLLPLASWSATVKVGSLTVTQSANYVVYVAPTLTPPEITDISEEGWTQVEGVFVYNAATFKYEPMAPLTAESPAPWGTYFQKIVNGENTLYVPFQVGAKATTDDYDYIYDKESWNMNVSASNGGLKAYYEANPNEDVWVFATEEDYTNDEKGEGHYGTNADKDAQGNWPALAKQSWWGAVGANGAKYPWIVMNTRQNAVRPLFKYNYDTSEPVEVMPWGLGAVKKYGCASLAVEFEDDNFLLPENGNSGPCAFDITKFSVDLFPEIAAFPLAPTVEYNGEQTEGPGFVVVGEGTAEGYTFEGTIKNRNTNEVGIKGVGQYFYVVKIIKDSEVKKEIESAPFKVTGHVIAINASQTTKLYGDPDPAPNYQFDAGSLMGDDTTEDLNEWLQFKRATGNEGEDCREYDYYIAYSEAYLAGNCNYEIKILQRGSILEIQPRPLTITIDEDCRSKVFGEEDPAYNDKDNYTVTGLKNGDTKETLDITISRLAGTNAGSYPFSAKVLKGEYQNYIVTVVPENFTIEPKTEGLQIVFSATDPDDYYYTGQAVEPAFDVFDGGTKIADEYVTKSWGGDGETKNNINVKRNAETNAVEAGATATATLSGNYAGAVVTKEFAVKPVTLTVTANNQEIENSQQPGDVTWTYNGWVTGENATNQAEAGLFEAPSGGYVEDTDDNFVKKTKVNQTAWAQNYNIVYVDGIVAIDRSVLTVAVVDASKIYGEEDPETFEVTVEGLHNGDTKESVLKVGTWVYTITREGAGTEAGENVGTYDLNITGPDKLKDYVVQYRGGEFTISRAEYFIVANDANKTYGQADPTFTFKVATRSGEDTEASPYVYTEVTGVNVPNNRVRAIHQNNIMGADDAGTHPIIVQRRQGNGNQWIQLTTWNTGNYTFHGVPGTLTVAKADVTLTPVDNQKNFGDEDPALKVTPDPIATDLYSEAVDYNQFVITREEGENAGTYAITLAPKTNPETGAEIAIGDKEVYGNNNVFRNFNVTLATTAATFTINAIPVQVKANSQVINYGQEINPYDVQIIIDNEEVDWTEAEIAEVVRLTTDVKKVGATADAFTAVPANGNSNYTFDPANDFTNAYLTIYPLTTIPLDSVMLAEICKYPLWQVLEDHKGTEVNFVMPRRTLVPDDWYAFVLPFDVTPRELSKAWGYAGFSRLDLEKSKGKTILFKQTTTPLVANEPFLAKVDQRIEKTEPELTVALKAELKSNAQLNLPENPTDAEYIAAYKKAKEAQDKFMDEIVFQNKLIPAKDAAGNDIFYATAGEPVNPSVGEAGNVNFVGLYTEKTGVDATQLYLARASGRTIYEFWPGGANSAAVVLRNTNAYLQFTTAEAAAEARVYIEDESGNITAINGVEANGTVNGEAIYNLSGQRVNKAQKGIYIQNGKKVLVK